MHHSWGEPDIRTYLPGETEVWSYPYKPNSNDVTAALLYTSSKDGDKGTFLDLKFVEGKLVSWQEAEHTLPAKGHTGIGLGIGGRADWERDPDAAGSGALLVAAGSCRIVSAMGNAYLQLAGTIVSN